MAWNEPGGNGKDPWGHRKNEQGPPDLDEVVKKIQKKIDSFFGGGGGGSGDGGGGISWSAIGIFFLIVIVIWLLFGFYIIQPAEQGVETRFGAYHQTTMQGLHWHIPYPVARVQKVNVEQVHALTLPEALMLTQDENIVKIQLVVQYRVSDAKNYLFNVDDPEKTLHQATESALREIVGTSKMDDVLTSERARVAIDTQDLIQKILDRYETGLLVTSVNMQDAQPPDQVQPAFVDVIKAREDEERHKNKAEAYSNEVIEKARGYSDQLREESKGYRAQVVARAKGQTQRFLQILTQYEKAPVITRKRLYLEMMEDVLGGNRKILIDIKQNNNLMLLPLDHLLNQGNQAAYSPMKDSTSDNTSTNNTSSSPYANESARSRDDARSRARGDR